jgi:diketogulonate reductase-like aldo/keto reductase
MMKEDVVFVLSNGVKIPSVGFGTWQIPDGEIAYNAVSCALTNGYRHIDTARTYGNEHSVGRAIRDCGLYRKEIFVTSKLPAEIKTYEKTLESFEDTLKSLGLDYIDLYLVHAPWPWNRQGYDYRKENTEVWKAMEEIYKSGRCRAIGVSNFEISDLIAILESCTIKPMVNQIRYFIGNTQNELVHFCRQNNIQIEGYSPLATGAILANRKVAAMARKYNTSLPKICIRYVLQKEVVPLPKSTNPGHIKQNSELNFEISATDMEYLDRLTGTIKGLKLSKIKSRVKKKLIAFEVLLRKMKFPLSIF